MTKFNNEMGCDFPERTCESCALHADCDINKKKIWHDFLKQMGLLFLLELFFIGIQLLRIFLISG